MAWTYDPTLPTDKDRVRLIIGDTLSIEPQLQDEEIQALLDLFGGSVRAAAIGATRGLAAIYARYADKWVGDLKILASQKHEAYLRLADSLEESTNIIGVGGGSGAPSAGGVYVGEKEAMEANTNRVSPFFYRGMHDHRGDC